MKHRIAVSLVITCLPTAWALADEPQAEAPPVAEAVVVEAAAARVQELIVAVDRAEAAEAVEEAKPAAQDGKAAEQQKTDEAELRKKMRELERELQDARNQFQQKANEQRAKAKQDAIKALDDITLAKNPTREQCEAYIAELRKACEGRRSFSSSDPATKKLKQLPPEHYDLLITEMANRTSLRYYANYAMRDTDPEQLRERFVNSLKDNPNNIGIIVMHGWCEDVRPEIISHLQNADGSITPAWFQAAVELDEPSLYPKLHEITTQSRYAGQFITMLEMLPEYDLAHTIDVCWRRAREGKLSVSFTTFAAKAAEFGNVEALGSLIDQLRSSSSYLSHSSTFNARRTNVLRYIDYRGSNKDIQEWYRANKDRLVFDNLRKRFYIPDDF
ncbi:MAG: hypothetical protein AAGC72_04225 [Planctomycetota bacterium]